MRALLLVDLQNDFFPGGALGIPGAESILPVINHLLEEDWDLIIATQDWHPKDHLSFASQHPSKKPGDHVKVCGIDQILWPDHCIQGTDGAEFHQGWDFSKVERVFHKGQNRLIDSYSAFFDNDHYQGTGLVDFLIKEGVDTLYIAGLATDYCVKYSVLDALKLHFNVTVVVDGCKAVNLSPHDEERVLKELKDKGAQIKLSSEVRL